MLNWEGFPYLDDSFIIGNTMDECQKAIGRHNRKLHRTGLHSEQREVSDFTHTILNILVFEIYSINMWVSLTEEKNLKHLSVIEEVGETNQHKVTIR